MREWLLISGALILLLSGCGGAPQRTAAPVTESGETPPPATTATEPAGESAVVVRAYEPPESPAALPSHGQAVQALLSQSLRQEQSGDLVAAVGSIERAQRIEPRNAYVWGRLAELRLKQGRHGMAEELAGKSNSLAGADLALKRKNWNLIAQARRAVGDIAGARVAERKARMLY